jgi:hypothetical protein
VYFCAVASRTFGHSESNMDEGIHEVMPEIGVKDTDREQRRLGIEIRQ